MANNDLPQEIQSHILDALKGQDPTTQAHVKRTSLGWMKLRVISTALVGDQIERERFINSLLLPLNLNLGKYPFAEYELLRPDEAVNLPKPIGVQLPLWSEILMTPATDTPYVLDEDTLRRPFVATFYSFKGGVGRSTALGLVAGSLVGRKRRVVVIDFDLEAPGLSVMFPQTALTPSLGVLDYLYQRYLTPDQKTPRLSDCLRQIELKTRGELYLVPVGEYTEDYIHRLADLSMRVFYQREINPIHQLIDDIKEQLDPDCILIDARAGFDETSAVALFDLADLAFICLSPTQQNFEGLKWVIKAARKQRDLSGKPDLRFVLTPIPSVAAEQRQAWIAQAEEWIAANWGIPPNLELSELYYSIPYSLEIPVLDSLIDKVPPAVLSSYQPLADVIDASLPSTNNRELTASTIRSRDAILRELEFLSVTAQDMRAEQIPQVFQRTEDFERFLNERIWLIRGAKGTGKSLLFRLFVEQPEQAEALAQSVKGTSFVTGHGPERLSGPILSSDDFRSYERQVGAEQWTTLWLHYALLRLSYSLPTQPAFVDTTLLESKASHERILAWLVEQSRIPNANSKTVDLLHQIDHQLEQEGKKAWVFFDELDAGFGSTVEDTHRRKAALEALLSWWLEFGAGFVNISPKIMLREDLWGRLDFTNKGHFASKSLRLKWDETDLWRLVLRQSLVSSQTLTDLLRKIGTTLDQLDDLDMPQLRKSLYVLWGERMGRGNKAYTHNWIRNRITDSQGNRFPRSLILLLQKAVEIECRPTKANPEVILRPQGLIDSLGFVSEQRVYEVRDEYPELRDALDRLRNARSPVEEDQLKELWGKKGTELKRLITEMVEAGIMQEYQRPPASDTPRYSVAELYLYGLGMRRSGQR